MVVRVFCLFSDWVAWGLVLLNFENSSYILHTNPLLDMWFVNVFP